jgi:hypothetical protein
MMGIADISRKEIVLLSARYLAISLNGDRQETRGSLSLYLFLSLSNNYLTAIIKDKEHERYLP